jgi:hypothetical protein
MKTGQFQRDVLGEIRKELEKGDAPVERLRELAKSALDLSDRHPDEVPADAVAALIDAHPELSEMHARLKEAQEKKDGEDIDRVKRSLDEIE